MAITLATLTGDVVNLVGDDFDTNGKTKVWVEANVDYIADLDNDVIRLGTALTEAATDGTFTFADLVATGSTDTNLDDSANLQYRIWVDYRSLVARQRVKKSFGWYSITADSNIVDLVEEQELSATQQGSFLAEVQAMLDEALAAAAITADAVTILQDLIAVEGTAGLALDTDDVPYYDVALAGFAPTLALLTDTDDVPFLVGA